MTYCSMGCSGNGMEWIEISQWRLSISSRRRWIFCLLLKAVGESRCHSLNVKKYKHSCLFRNSCGNNVRPFITLAIASVGSIFPPIKIGGLSTGVVVKLVSGDCGVVLRLGVIVEALVWLKVSGVKNMLLLLLLLSLLLSLLLLLLLQLLGVVVVLAVVAVVDNVVVVMVDEVERTSLAL